MHTATVRPLAALLGAALLSILYVGLVQADARYVRSEPADGTTLSAAPQRVTIWFSQILESTGNSITVVDATGAVVSQGAAQLLATDHKALHIALRPNLGPGRYTVQWRNVSAEDGHSGQGAFTFTVAAAAAPVAATPAARTETPAPTTRVAAQPARAGGPSVVAIAAGLGTAGMGLILAGLALRRRAQPPRAVGSAQPGAPPDARSHHSGGHPRER